MNPLDVTQVLEELSASITPGTIIIVKLFDAADSAEEIDEDTTDISDAYDMFANGNGSPSTGGGTTSDAILMDNPGQ